MKKYIAVIGGIVASLPWIEQISDLKLIPDHWDLGPSIISIVVSVLCFVVVAILYASKQKLALARKSRIIALTVPSFLLFATSIISLLFILDTTKNPVSECCKLGSNNECLENIVFVPLFLPAKINNHLTEYEMSMDEWIILDQCHVNEQLIEIGGSEIKSSYTKTMLLIYGLYLSVFVFLILAIVPLGYNTVGVNESD